MSNSINLIPMTTTAKTVQIQPGEAKPQHNLISIDAGNFAIKSCRGNQISEIRSTFRLLPTNANTPRHDGKNPVVTLPTGERYALGHYAGLMQGSQQIANTKKEQYGLLLTLAALTPDDCSSPIDLVFSHFQPETEGQRLSEVLQGVHHFGRNGAKLTADIASVTIVPEGLGSFWLAQAKGLLPDSGLTILLDLGGGSYLARIVDETGYEVAPSITAAKGGAIALANSIATDMRLVQPLKAKGVGSIKSAPVLEAFQDGSFRYAETGISFKDWMGEHLNPWFDAIVDEVTTAYESYFDRVTSCLITGGGSHLVKARVGDSEFFRFPPSPHIANAVGSYLHFSRVQR